MKYYRVPAAMDQKPRFKYYSNGRKIIDFCFIANELYTERELQPFRVNLNNFEVVEIPKSKIYFCFGCRFEMEDPDND